MNKILLSTISTMALTASYSNALAYTGAEPCVPCGLSASAAPLTQAQLQSVYSSLVAEGIADGTIYSNFASDVTLTFTTAQLPSLASFSSTGSYTGSANKLSAVITIGPGITSTAEAEAVIAHEIALAQDEMTFSETLSQGKLNSVPHDDAMSAEADTAQYGVFNLSTIQAVNDEEQWADDTAASIMGVQNYINGLSAIAANEITAASTYGIARLDANTMFIRAVNIAQNNLGTAYTIPANLIPGYTGSAALTLKYDTSGELDTTVTSSQLVTLIPQVETTLGNEEKAGDVVDSEYNNGASDLLGLGSEAPATPVALKKSALTIAASPLAGLTPSQLQSTYTTVVAAGIANKTLATGFAMGVDSSAQAVSTGLVTTGLASYNPANSLLSNSEAVMDLVGSNITTTAEAEMIIAHEIGIDESQTLETAAAAAVSKYGMSSSQAITAVNALEMAADKIGSNIIGVQNYINGLSTMEANEITLAKSASTAAPTDVDTLFERTLQLAQAHPGVEYTVPANLVPGDTGTAALNLEYTNATTLNTTATSSLVAADASSVTGALATETTAGNATLAEYNNGGSDLINIGVGAPATTTPVAGSMTQAQLLSQYNTLVAAGIKAGILPSTFTTSNTFDFAATEWLGLGEYIAGATGTIELGYGITSSLEAETVIAQQIGLAQSQTVENAAATAAATYGVDSSPAITAVNAAEASANAIGAELIGAQNYVTGLSDIQFSETAAVKAGGNTLPANTEALFDEVQLIAQANPGTKFTIPANLNPDGTSLTMEYANATSLDSAVDSSAVASLVAEDNALVSVETGIGDAADAQFGNGAGNMANVGSNAEITDQQGAQNAAATAASQNQSVLAGLEANGWGSYLDNVTENLVTTGAPGQSEFVSTYNSAGEIIGGVINLNIVGLTEAQANAVEGHEDGHMDTPVAEEAAFDAQQALAADPTNIDLQNTAIEASQDAENEADIIEANNYGEAALQNGQTFASGVQTMIDNYFGPMSPDQDADHGSLIDQVAAVAAANPNITLTIPQSAIQDMVNTNQLLVADTVGIQSFTIQGNVITAIPFSNVAPPPAANVAADDAAFDTAENTDAADNDGKTLTDASITEQNDNGDGDTGDGDGNTGDGGDGDGDGGDGGDGGRE